MRNSGRPSSAHVSKNRPNVRPRKNILKAFTGTLQADRDRAGIPSAIVAPQDPVLEAEISFRSSHEPGSTCFPDVKSRPRCPYQSGKVKNPSRCETRTTISPQIDGVFDHKGIVRNVHDSRKQHRFVLPKPLRHTRELHHIAERGDCTAVVERHSDRW